MTPCLIIIPPRNSKSGIHPPGTTLCGHQSLRIDSSTTFSMGATFLLTGIILYRSVLALLSKVPNKWYVKTSQAPQPITQRSHLLHYHSGQIITLSLTSISFNAVGTLTLPLQTRPFVYPSYEIIILECRVIHIATTSHSHDLKQKRTFFSLRFSQWNHSHNINFNSTSMCITHLNPPWTKSWFAYLIKFYHCTHHSQYLMLNLVLISSTPMQRSYYSFYVQVFTSSILLSV